MKLLIAVVATILISMSIVVYRISTDLHGDVAFTVEFLRQASQGL